MRISDWSSDVCSSDLGRTVSISNGGTQRLSVVTGVVAGMLPNTAPVITSEPPASAAIGETYSYPLAAGDGAGQAIFFGLLAAPEGMTVAREPGLLTWTTPADASALPPVIAEDFAPTRPATPPR